LPSSGIVPLQLQISLSLAISGALRGAIGKGSEKRERPLRARRSAIGAGGIARRLRLSRIGIGNARGRWLHRG
jgi:hypothetical protein